MMKTLVRRFGSRGAGVAAAGALVLGIASTVALQSSSAANAATASCADPAAAPTGPATVSQGSSAYGKVLVIGSGAYEGCSLYLLTSDQLHSVAGAHFA